MTARGEDGPLIPDRLASGRIIDLAHPPVEFNWGVELAGPISRVARYAGQVPDFIYSVGEHEVRGADAVYAEAIARGATHVEAVKAALAFLLHDKHETLSGDAKRPFVDLIELLATRSGLVPGGVIRRAIEDAKEHLDAALYRAAGMPWPLPPEIRRIVADMDERMAAEEMRRFWPRIPLPAHYETRARVIIPDWQGRTVDTYPPWTWQRTAAEWMSRFQAWAPAKAQPQKISA